MTVIANAFDIASATPTQRAWELMRLLNNDDLYDEKQALSLIEAGLETENETEHGDRPLSSAAFHGRTAVAKALIAARADVNARDIFNMTPLMGAASGGHTEIFAALVAAGAKVDLRDDFDEDAFHGAAENGKEDIVRALIRLNVTLDHPNKDGKTPRKAAFDKGHLGVVKIIDDAIFERDEPARQQERERQLERQQVLLHIGDSFRDGLKTAKIAPETASFRPKSAR